MTYTVPLPRTRRTNSLGWTQIGLLTDANLSVPYYSKTQYTKLVIDEKHGRAPYHGSRDRGGPFDLFELSLQRGSTKSAGSGSLEGWGYYLPTDTQGRIYAGDFVDVVWPNSIWAPGNDNPLWSDSLFDNERISFQASAATLNGLGATAWERFKPGKPLSSSDQAALEVLKDGVPSVPGVEFLKSFVRTRQTALSSFRALGSEFLNIEFGWKPLVHDLQAVYKAVHILDKRLSQLRRDNGQPVRRRGEFDVDRKLLSRVEKHGNYMFPIITTEFYGPASSPANREIRTIVESSSCHFSARFRYWIPDLGPLRFPDRTKRALFGVNPTPSLLWEVMPWSWLIDWFTNLGDVISNMSTNAAENLVADYAYVTKRAKRELIVNSSVALRGGIASCESILTRKSIQRAKANPYGFAFTFPDLTSRQMAILAALGLSRS